MSFLDHISGIEDPRILGMVTFPLDEILLATLSGLLCRCEDFDEIEEFANAELDWLRQFLPFAEGIPTAQTFRKLFRLLDPGALEAAFSGWVRSLQDRLGGVIAVDGKSLRGTRSGKDRPLHTVAAYAHEAGLVLGQHAVDGKSNEITAIPDLLETLALEGAIVTIDAMGCQKAIAAKIVDQGGEYLLALKGNQRELHEDVHRFFEDPALASQCLEHSETCAGHGRVEERHCRVADVRDWLPQRHPDWPALATIAAVTAIRTDKATGENSTQTRYYIASVAPDPEKILHAARAHWSIGNNMHWQLDVTFSEDASRTRKDNAPLNLAIIRRAVFNMLKADTSKGSLKRKRLRAGFCSIFREKLIPS